MLHVRRQRHWSIASVEPITGNPLFSEPLGNRISLHQSAQATCTHLSSSVRRRAPPEEEQSAHSMDWVAGRLLEVASASVEASEVSVEYAEQGSHVHTSSTTECGGKP